MSHIKSIFTKADYKAALERIEELIAANPIKGSDTYDELDMIGSLVAAYEDIHFPIA